MGEIISQAKVVPVGALPDRRHVFKSGTQRTRTLKSAALIPNALPGT
jgi:hypothetical protein